MFAYCVKGVYLHPMNKQLKRTLLGIWNCRAKLPIQTKVKVRAIQAQQELLGNKMTQDKTLEYIITKFKN